MIFSDGKKTGKLRGNEFLDIVAVYSIIVILGSILEYFGSKRMGFMRYLVFMNSEIHGSILSFKSICYGVGTMVVIAGLIYVQKDISVLRKRSTLCILTLTAILLVTGYLKVMQSQAFMELLLLAGAGVIAGVSWIRR